MSVRQTYPALIDYREALSNPRVVFTDPKLKQYQVEETIQGPRVLSGGFALTFHLLDGGGPGWAVRCFQREISELEQRYRAIDTFLRAHPSIPYFTGVQYQPNGIWVNGRPWPIIAMPWITGKNIWSYISDHLSQTSTLKMLAMQVRQLGKTLDTLGIAHGDLQEGNILVDPQGELRLIDYDGIYVPALKGLSAQNLGKPNFQHPRRTASDFGPTMDRFSLIVLYLGIFGTAVNPGLWEQYGQDGDRILLRAEDFVRPEQSAVLRELEQIPELTEMVESFRSVCKADFAKVPSLEDFITHHLTVAPSMRPAVVAPRLQCPIVSALDHLRLEGLQGQVIEVVGYVEGIDLKRTYGGTGSVYAFIDFDDWRLGGFRLVVWPEHLAELRRKGRDIHAFNHQWIRITGLITVYRNPRVSAPQRAQIEVEGPGKLAIISKSEAMSRLEDGKRYRSQSQPVWTVGVPVAPVTPPTKSPAPTTGGTAPRATIRPAARYDDEIWDRLYKNFPVPAGVSPTPYPPPKGQAPVKGAPVHTSPTTAQCYPASPHGSNSVSQSSIQSVRPNLSLRQPIPIVRPRLPTISRRQPGPTTRATWLLFARAVSRAVAQRLRQVSRDARRWWDSL